MQHDFDIIREKNSLYTDKFLSACLNLFIKQISFNASYTCFFATYIQMRDIIYEILYD